MDIQTTQREVRRLLQHIQHPRVGTVLGLHEEVGELAKVIMNWEIYGEKDPKAFQEECADIFFSLLDICNAYGVELDSACAEKFEKTKSHIAEWEKKYGRRLESLRSLFDHEP